MSVNKDAAKINFIQFIEVFKGLMDLQPRDAPNRTIFNLLDVKNQGCLNIL